MPTLMCPVDGCGYVTVKGDAPAIAALLTVHGYVHAGAAASAKKPDRPVVDSYIAASEWSMFKFEWERYS